MPARKSTMGAPAERFTHDLVPAIVSGRGVNQADHDQEDRQVPVDANGQEAGGHGVPRVGFAGCVTVGTG